MLRFSTLLTAFLLVAAITTGYCARPNFVIIMADDMGYGDSSAYNGWIKTPNMERMAREGLKFTDFHSSGTVCSPTRAGLMTGRYQQRTGVAGVVNADPDTEMHYWGLQTSEVTFAKLLRGAGYRTAIYGKWHLGYAKEYNPLHHGFDLFHGFVSGNIDYLSHYDRMETFDWWHGLEKVRETGYLTHLLTRDALKFIREHKDQSFCLYVPHGAVHSPIQGPDSPAQRGPDKERRKRDPKNQQATVRAMMKALDDNIGAVLDVLKETGLAENTLVLFFSDNGGASHMRNDPLRGGKGTVWEGGHRVPALAWWPGTIQPGQINDDLCISLDVMPTLLALAEVPTPAGHKLDGVSLDKLLKNSQSPGDRQLFWDGAAMRDGSWKLVRKARGLKEPALYDLSKDLGEQNNLAAKHQDRVERMTRALANWQRDVANGATVQPGRKR